MKKFYPTFFVLLLAAVNLNTAISSEAKDNVSEIRFDKENVDGVNIFYRETGDHSKQAVVLLHGFPSSSHQYRALLSALGDEFYLIAPDYPGFGYSDKPDIKDYSYTFDNLATTMAKFLTQLEIKNYVLLIHDYGAPVGFRIATKHPEHIAGFIVMNGNAYEEGLSDLTNQSLSSPRTKENEASKIANFMSLEGIKWMYTEGTRNPDGINPDGWHLDHAIMNGQNTQSLNLELLYDYPNNIKRYPQWQQYLRETQPPMLILWGKNDPIFPEPGAAAYKKDIKGIDYHILDTGHFPLEEDAPFIIAKIRDFLRDF